MIPMRFGLIPSLTYKLDSTPPYSPPPVSPKPIPPYLYLPSVCCCPWIYGNSSIPREIAAILAPQIDRGIISIEGTVVGPRNAYYIPISIELFTPTPSATLASPSPSPETTQSYLRSRGLDMRPEPVLPGQRTPIRTGWPVPPNPPGTAPGTEYKALLQNFVAFDPRRVRDATEKFGMSLRDLEGLPLATQPKMVKTKMLRYQLQGLRWMLGMENPRLPQMGEEGEIVQFWTRRGGNWLNVASNLYYLLKSPFLPLFVLVRWGLDRLGFCCVFGWIWGSGLSVV